MVLLLALYAKNAATKEPAAAIKAIKTAARLEPISKVIGSPEDKASSEEGKAKINNVDPKFLTNSKCREKETYDRKNNEQQTHAKRSNCSSSYCHNLARCSGDQF